MTKANPSEEELDELYAKYMGDTFVDIKTARQWIADDGLTLKKIVDHAHDCYKRMHGGSNKASIFVRIGDVA